MAVVLRAIEIKASCGRTFLQLLGLPISYFRALLFQVSLGSAYPQEELSREVRDMDQNSVHILPRICVLFVPSSVPT